MQQSLTETKSKIKRISLKDIFEQSIEWLLKNRERVDRWSSDQVYEKYIKEFEKDVIEKIKNDKPEIIEAIQSSGKLDEDTENQLKQVIEEYKKK